MSISSSRLSMLKSTLVSLFGKAWPLWLIGLAIFTLWPILLFWSQITLNPAGFTQIWIEKCVEGILFFVVVEVIRNRQQLHDKLDRDSMFVDDRLLDPMQSLARSLKPSTNSGRSPGRLQEIERSWGTLRNALQDDLMDTVAATKNSRTVSMLVARLRIDQCQSMIDELLSPTTPSDVFAKTSQELLGRIESFHKDILPIVKPIQTDQRESL